MSLSFMASLQVTGGDDSNLTLAFATGKLFHHKG
jgi:hypothetical protein